MKRIGLYSAALGCFVLVLLLIISLTSFGGINPEEKEDLEQARALLEVEQTDEALSIITNYQESIEEEKETGKEWLDLLITAYANKRDGEQLLALYDYNPEAFINHEDAALLVAKNYLDKSHLTEYQTIRDYWLGFEEHENEWFALDADRLMLEGRDDEALRHLNSKTFSGKADVSRLARIASLHKESRPQEAWNILTLAQKKDPQNPEVLLAKGQLLEGMGNKEAALNEYKELARVRPHDVAIQEHFATFLVRGKKYKQALELWGQNLSNENNWLNTLFWSRAATPTSYDLKKHVPPYSPFLHYLLTLKNGEFWNKQNFAQVPNGKEIIQTEQAAFWLTLLSALKQENDHEAWALIQTTPFQEDNWNPDAFVALKHLLSYRGAGQIEVEGGSDVLFEEDIEEADGYLPLLATLAKHAQPGHHAIETTDELDEFLHSREAVATIFLHTGWKEAALNLYPLQNPTGTAPDWVIVLLTKALFENRGSLKALEFAAAQYPRVGLNDAVREILVSSQHSDLEMEKIHQLAQQNSDLGFRCAKMIGQVYFDGGKQQAAKRVIYAQRRLSNSLIGKELLARIALKEGDSQTAEKLYQTILNDSVEAKSFFAKKAFSEGDWRIARSLTEQLLQQFPDNPTLQQNMRQILSHQQK